MLVNTFSQQQNKFIYSLTKNLYVLAFLRFHQILFWQFLLQHKHLYTAKSPLTFVY